MTISAFLTLDSLNTLTGIFPTQAMADAFGSANSGSTAKQGVVDDMPRRVNVGWCYHAATDEVWEEHPLTDLQKLHTGINVTRDFFHEVQDSISCAWRQLPFAVVNRTHDCFAGVRKGVYLVACNNTDLTILQRLFFLENTRIGPQDLTVTDVHGKVLKFLHWAEGDGRHAVTFSWHGPCLCRILKLGRG